jgi:hypothetical protein
MLVSKTILIGKYPGVHFQMNLASEWSKGISLPSREVS